jgi:hypothetical protein
MAAKKKPTAEGFVLLSLEDETGIANIVVKPDVFARLRVMIFSHGYLLVDGILQNQRGVVSVKRTRLYRFRPPPLRCRLRTISTSAHAAFARVENRLRVTAAANVRPERLLILLEINSYSLLDLRTPLILVNCSAAIDRSRLPDYSHLSFAIASSRRSHCRLLG